MKSNIGHRRALAWVLTAVVALSLAGCTDSKGIGTPTAPTAGSTPSARSVSAPGAIQVEGLSGEVTDVTLASAGWSCLQLANGVMLCGPPGLGLPPIPPATDGQPTYNVMAFTPDHQFLHDVKLLRPDLYHGQPCQGADPWRYIDFLNYYECIIPGRGEQ